MTLLHLLKQNPISNNGKIINTIAVLFLGIALGTFSKYLDFRQAELPGVLMAIDEAFDIHNFLGRFAIWVLIALCISIYSNSAIRASYAMIWFGFTAVSPLLSFVCWYFNAKSVLEVIVFIIGLIVLRRDTLRSSALMGTISIVLAFLFNIIIPFWIDNFLFSAPFGSTVILN